LNRINTRDCFAVKYKYKLRNGEECFVEPLQSFNQTQLKLCMRPSGTLRKDRQNLRASSSRDPPCNDRLRRVPFSICTQRLVTAGANLHAHKAGREDCVKFHPIVIEPHVYLSEATWDGRGSCSVIDDAIK